MLLLCKRFLLAAWIFQEMWMLKNVTRTLWSEKIGKWKLINSLGIRQPHARFVVIQISLFPANGLIWNLPPSEPRLIVLLVTFMSLHISIDRRGNNGSVDGEVEHKTKNIPGRKYFHYNGSVFNWSHSKLIWEIKFPPLFRPSYVEILCVCAILIKLSGKISSWWKKFA